MICLALPTPYRLEITNFSHTPLIWYITTLVQGDPFHIYGKALRILKLESSRQAADGKDLVILAWTVFD